MTTLCNGPRTGCMLLIAAVLIGTGVAQEAAPSPFASRFFNLRESPHVFSWFSHHKGPSPPFVQPPAEPPAKAPQPTSYTVWYKLTVSINRVGGDGWLGGDAEIVGKAAGKEVFRILAKKGYYGASGLVPLDGRVYEKTYPYDPSVATVLLPDDSKELNFHIFEEDGDGFFDQLYFFTVRQLELRLTPGITRGNADVHWNVKCGSLYRWERFRKDNCDFVVTVTHQRGIEWHY